MSDARHLAIMAAILFTGVVIIHAMTGWDLGTILVVLGITWLVMKD